MLRFIVSLIAALLAGCAVPRDDATTPAACEPQREFHVVGHGWHTGVVIRGRDLEARLRELPSLGPAGQLELGWGDAAFYRAPEPTMSLALRAVLYPTDAVLHVVALPASDLRSSFPGSTIFTLRVPASGYEQLLDYLVRTFVRAPDGAPVPLERGLYGESRFYRAKGQFHAFNTCNTWVAGAVEATGFPLRGAAVVTADELLSALRQVPDTPCHVAAPAS